MVQLLGIRAYPMYSQLQFSIMYVTFPLSILFSYSILSFSIGLVVFLSISTVEKLASISKSTPPRPRPRYFILYMQNQTMQCLGLIIFKGTRSRISGDMLNIHLFFHDFLVIPLGHV